MDVRVMMQYQGHFMRVSNISEMRFLGFVLSSDTLECIAWPIEEILWSIFRERIEHLS